MKTAAQRSSDRKKSQKRSFFLSMLRIGAIGFGGGSALIPVIGEAVTKENAFVTEEEYERDVVAAAITPGALPVEIAAGLGRTLFGRGGMVLSAVLMALPGSIVTFALLAVLAGVNRTVMTITDCLSVGITAFICTILFTYVLKTVMPEKPDQGSKGGRGIRRFLPLLVAASVFFLNGGENLSVIFGIKGLSVLNLDTLSILGLAFFVVFFTRGRLNKVNVLVCAAASLLFIFGRGTVRTADGIAMLILGAGGFAADLGSHLRKANAKRRTADTDEDDNPGSRYLRALGGDLLIWGGMLAAAAAIAFAVTGKQPLFVAKGLLSSLISFGGGDAYLSVAKGMFVQNGPLSDAQFYGNLIPVANLLPGSILCKVLAGTGYLAGYALRKSVLDGFLLWLAGFLTAAAGSGLAFGAVRLACDVLENLRVFQLLSRWIRPIIAGLLINIGLSLIHQNLATGVTLGISAGAAAAVTALIMIGNLLLLYRKRVGSGAMILFSACTGMLTTAALVFI